MTVSNFDIFFQQSHENLRVIERHIHRSRDLLNRFAEYRNELTRDQFIETLKIAQELSKWIIDNAGDIDFDSRG